MHRSTTDRARANEALQESLQRAEPRIVASYALVGAILLLEAPATPSTRGPNRRPGAF